MPVLTAGRPELERSLELANALYGAVVRPRGADVGVRLGDELDVDDNWVVGGLAARWVAEDELPSVLDGIADGSAARVLILGIYERLASAPVLRLLGAAERRAGAAIGVVGGRDVASTTWMAAKQWVRPHPDVTGYGLLSEVTGLEDDSGIQVWGPRELSSRNVRARLMATRWRSLMLCGHARDDYVSVGYHTLCGRSGAADEPGAYRPQCGYGLGCFKPEGGLIDPRALPAVEVVLAGCHTGTPPDIALYAPRYSLLLSALDGPAQRVSAALTANRVGHPEHEAWADEVRAWADGAPEGPERASAVSLDAMLRARMPIPTLWHFGMPPRAAAEAVPVPDPAPELLVAGRRVHGLLTASLLAPGHRARPALGEVNELLSAYLDHDGRSRDARRASELSVRVQAAVAALDAVLADCIRANPEDDLMKFDSYFFRRGALDHATIRDETCPSCGRPATRFAVRPRLPAMLPVTFVLCVRCGDVEAAMLDTPRLTLEAPRRMTAGERADIALTVAAASPGTVWMGAFASASGRLDLVVEPALEPRRLEAGERVTLRGMLHASLNSIPQERHVRAFVVSNAGLGTTEHRLRILSRPADR